MRKGLAAAGVVALITAGSAACGADKTTPQGKVENAFGKLGDQKTVTLGLSIDGTADQIYAALKDEDVSRSNAAVMSSLHLSLAVTSQKSFNLLTNTKANKGDSFALALSSEQAPDTNLAEVRYVNQKAYLRFDIKGLEKLDTSGSNSSELDQFLTGADQLPSSLASVKAALKGKWVSIDPKAFEEFAKSMGGSDSGDGSGDDSFGGSGMPFPMSTPSLTTQQQKQLVAGLKQAFTKDVTYTDLGSKDGADHIRASVPARPFVKDLAVDLEPVLKQFPGFEASDLADMKAAKGVPNKNISVDLALKGGDIQSVTFNVSQLDTKAHGAVPVTLTLDGSAKPVSAPSGALQLNPQDLVGLFMADMPKGMDDADSSI